MSVSPGYRDFILDLLHPLDPGQARRDPLREVGREHGELDGVAGDVEVVGDFEVHGAARGYRNGGLAS